MLFRSRRFLTVVVLSLVVGLCPARADGVGAVKEKLYQAKKEYDSDVRKFRKTVTDWLNKREEEARQAGNTKALNQVKAEREAFEKAGELPAKMPAAVHDQIKNARVKLDRAYTAAVKDYLRLKDDEAVDATEKEQQSFQISSAFQFGRRAPLTALKPFNVQTEKNGFVHDFMLKIQDSTVPHIIRLDPVSEGTSQASYTLTRRWSALRVRVGVPKFEDTVRAPASDLIFEVVGDQNSLWKSKPTKNLDEFQTCEVNLTKVKVLILRVHCSKSADWARACWLEPILAE